MKYGVLAGLLLVILPIVWPAAAQPEQPMPTASTPVADVLAASPHLDISNGLITARIAPPDLARGFYRGTRFDQTGENRCSFFISRSTPHDPPAPHSFLDQASLRNQFQRTRNSRPRTALSPDQG